jgi:putative transcriptional regulator
MCQKEDEAMKKHITAKQRKPSTGSRIVASLKEAVDWIGGKDVAVRVTTVEVPTIDVRATRRRLGLSQAEFASKFGFQPATLRNWEQGRTRPDGPARADVVNRKTLKPLLREAILRDSVNAF